MEEQNRRGAPRVSCQLDVRYVRQGGHVHRGSALNISQTGARLVVDQDSDVRELTIEFEGKLAVLARTVWEQPLPGGKQLVGVMFEGLHWGQRVALDDYVLDVETRAA